MIVSFTAGCHGNHGDVILYAGVSAPAAAVRGDNVGPSKLLGSLFPG